MSFSIVFDYRFDTSGFYDDPAARAVMDRAAEIWSGLIKDEFDDVAAGTTFSVWNPSAAGQRETVTLTEDLDDLMIFAGGRDLASLGLGGFSGTDAQGDVFASRISGDFRDTGVVTDFEPWAGVITIDPANNWGFGLDAPEAGKNDLLTTVLHEIGHILGIGTAAAFKDLVTDDTFNGVNTRALNGGQGIPLEHDHGHVEDSFHDDDVLLDPTSIVGTRTLPGAIDLAILADIGYEIDGFVTQGHTPDLATDAGETIRGTLLEDRIDALEGADLVFGQEGDDTIDGGTGDDQLQGGTGRDSLSGDAGSDTLFGQEGEDILTGGLGDDFLLGGDGNDTLRGGGGDDSIRAGGGADHILLERGMGSDTVFDFEFGLDTLDLGALSAAERAGIEVTGTQTLRIVTLPDGSEIYVQGTQAETAPGLSLTGEAVQNGTLAASFHHNVPLFSTSVVSATYSWLRADAVIAGATGSTYVPQQADVGFAISVRVVSGSGADQTVTTSAATSVVRNVNDLPTGGITVSGTPVVGHTLEANSASLGDADGLGTLSYQWLRDGVAIADATSGSYRLEAPDAQTALSVQVAYTDGHGTLETVTSAGHTVTLHAQEEEHDHDHDHDHTAEGATPQVLTATDAGARLEGGALNDTLQGGQGNDTLLGGDGDDMIHGGIGTDDLRDVVFAGAGNDTVQGGYGNDSLRGDAGDDVIEGGFGADTAIGGAGNDTLTGGALGDLLFGADGDDFINGGFGFDRVNGGAGADRFFHLGTQSHGADWIQDYDVSVDGDTLVFGDNTARADQFQINSAFTAGAGSDDIAEVFVVFKPTGQIVWALVDGMGREEIHLTLGGEVFDLLG